MNVISANDSAALDFALGAVETPHFLPMHGSPRLLLVDDDVRLLDLESRTLRALGYQVTTSADPLVALDMLRANPGGFDLVITDLRMDAMNGLELARSVFEERADMPVVMISGNMSELEEDGARAMGVSEVLRKPLEKDKLARRIRAALDQVPRSSSPGDRR